MRPALASIVGALPATTPFVSPEAIERQTGVRLSIRLGANESLFGPSPAALAALRQAADEIHLYGDPEATELRQAIAAFHGLTPDHLVLGSGIDELLGLFARAYADPGETAVMSSGGYPTMAYQFNAHGVRIATVPYREDRNDALALADEARAVGAKLLYLANPDNPSGSWLARQAVQQVLERLPATCLLLLDEAYAEFAPTASLLPLDPDDTRLVRFRTFSKVHGLAGLRVGYAMGAPSLVRPIDRIRNQFGVGRMAQAGALAALADQDHARSVVDAFTAGRAHYAEIAAAAGCRALPSATNFVAIDVGSKVHAQTVLRALQVDHGVFVRMPTAPPLDRCIRVTVGPPDARAAFGQAFREVIARVK